MKRLYISEVIHEHLKKEAKRRGRTLQWVVEERLTNDSSTHVFIDTPVSTEVKESPAPTKRTKKVVLKEINTAKDYIKDLENQTVTNQDPDLLEVIEEEKALYQGLLNEYNKLG